MCAKKNSRGLNGVPNSLALHFVVILYFHDLGITLLMEKKLMLFFFMFCYLCDIFKNIYYVFKFFLIVPSNFGGLKL